MLMATEKRFTIKEIDNFSYGIKVTDIILDNGIELPQSTVCDLLNNLVKENEYLHKYNTNLQKQPLLFDVQTIPNTMKIIEANTQLEEENNQLKKELQRIYDITTVNKVKNIVEEIYGDLLYETSEKSDYAREMVLKCLEKIEGFGDDLE